MKPLIIANWKLNPSSLEEAKKLFGAIKRIVTQKSIHKSVEVVICPPFIYLPLLKGVTLGAQDTFWEEKGAFTGEVSPIQLKDLKVQYVIIGHSERRKYFSETDELINKKIKKALDAKLSVVLCVGETQEERNVNKTQEVIERQITEGLRGVSKLEIQNSKLAVAYEPVWAIGTGNSCSPDQTMSSILLIRKIISNLYNRQLADEITILYGGSVTSKNSAQYIQGSGANGLLVGGASLNAEEFEAIIKSVTNKTL
ncbi:MAG: triose-phosphate isomerase [Candidatus Staskawiczbacteria bacterium]|nr:triose-phosphate isomerase [Candidatus Staskawiczbacteria bacterium]